MVEREDKEALDVALVVEHYQGFVPDEHLDLAATQHWEQAYRRDQEWQPVLMLLVAVLPKGWLGVAALLDLAPASPVLWLAERQVGCFLLVPVSEAGFQIVVTLEKTAALVLISVRSLQPAEALSKASLMELQVVLWNPGFVRLGSPRRLSSAETRVAVGQACSVVQGLQVVFGLASPLRSAGAVPAAPLL